MHALNWPKADKLLSRCLWFATIGMVPTFSFSQTSPNEPPPTINGDVTLNTGLSLTLQSENGTSENYRDQQVTLPFSLSVELTPSISTSFQTSLVRTSSKVITSSDTVSESLSGIGSTLISLDYKPNPDESSTWPALSVAANVYLLTKSWGISSDDNDQLRSASIEFGLNWPSASMRSRISFPLGEPANFFDESAPSADSEVSSASFGFTIKRTFQPVFFSASTDVSYQTEYDVDLSDFGTITITPGLSYSFDVAANFFISDEVSFNSTVGIILEKNIQINNTLISDTGAETVNLDLGLRYMLSTSQTIRPSLAIEFDEDGRSSVLSISYTHIL